MARALHHADGTIMPVASEVGPKSHDGDPVTSVEESPEATSGRSLTAMGRNWFVYGISSIASRLVGFLLLPVYTRVLTPEEYGIRAMVTLGVDVVGMLFSLGIGVAMVRF